MTTLLNNQLRNFDSAWAALEKEHKELTEHFNVARNLACSRWNNELVPSPSGGYEGLTPVIILPEKMDLLIENYHALEQDIHDRKKALVVLYGPAFKKAKRSFDNAQSNYVPNTKRKAS